MNKRFKVDTVYSWTHFDILGNIESFINCSSETAGENEKRDGREDINANSIFSWKVDRTEIFKQSLNQTLDDNLQGKSQLNVWWVLHATNTGSKKCMNMYRKK